MSYPPPSPPAGDRGSQLLKGCAIGCLAFVVLLGASGLFVYVKFVRPAVQGVENLKKAGEETEAARQRLTELDTTHAWTRGDDVSVVDISEEDLRRYLDARAALAPKLAAVAAARSKLVGAIPSAKDGKAPGSADMLGFVSGMVTGGKAFVEAQRDLVVEAEKVLSARGMGPTELERMAEIVEWRFLQRPELSFLGLPDWRRDELLEERVKVMFAEPFVAAAKEQPGWGGGQDAEQAMRELEASRRRIAELEAEASGNVALTDATRAVLEPRRQELGALATEGIDVLARIRRSDPTLTIH